MSNRLLKRIALLIPPLRHLYQEQVRAWKENAELKQRVGELLEQLNSASADNVYSENMTADGRFSSPSPRADPPLLSPEAVKSPQDDASGQTSITGASAELSALSKRLDDEISNSAELREEVAAALTSFRDEVARLKRDLDLPTAELELYRARSDRQRAIAQAERERERRMKAETELRQLACTNS